MMDQIELGQMFVAWDPNLSHPCPLLSFVKTAGFMLRYNFKKMDSSQPSGDFLSS